MGLRSSSVMLSVQAHHLVPTSGPAVARSKVTTADPARTAAIGVLPVDAPAAITAETPGGDPPFDAARHPGFDPEKTGRSTSVEL